MILKPGTVKMRPMDTPTPQDRIVQEAIREILEAIYQLEFQDWKSRNGSKSTNYGFRFHKSTWMATNVHKVQGQATTYAIEGDIVGAYNNVEHQVLLNRRIKDKK